MPDENQLLDTNCYCQISKTQVGHLIGLYVPEIAVWGKEDLQQVCPWRGETQNNKGKEGLQHACLGEDGHVKRGNATGNVCGSSGACWSQIIVMHVIWASMGVYDGGQKGDPYAKRRARNYLASQRSRG